MLLSSVSTNRIENQENSKCFELILGFIKNTNDVFESDIDIKKRFQTDANDYK
jgi:hypothetical protein